MNRSKPVTSPLALFLVLSYFVLVLTGCGSKRCDTVAQPQYQPSVCNGADNNPECSPIQLEGYSTCLRANGNVYGSPFWNAWVNECNRRWQVYP